MRSLLRRRLLLPIIGFLAVVGPAFITANVDNDAPGIATYSAAGAHYGYEVLWLLWPTLLVLIVVQEMSARMGVATGKGLADLIREEFGPKVTVWLMLALVVVNVTNTAGEFAGLAEGAAIFGISKYLSVPAAAFLVWLLVLRGSYQSVERIFLVACLVYLAYPISGFLARPDWAEIGRQSVRVTFIPDVKFLATSVAIVGTTIAPWMQFYLQATVVEKGTRPAQYWAARWDVILGAIFAIIVVFFIVIACAATIHPLPLGQDITAAGAATALRPLAGKYASILFAIGLINAALFASSILPLSTAYTVCEGIGWEKGLDQKLRDAPQFYVLYALMIVIGAGIVLLPGVHLIRIMLFSQVLNGLLLPAILIAMVRLVTRREIMGPLTASRWYAAVCWAMTILLIGLDAYLVAVTVG